MRMSCERRAPPSFVGSPHGLTGVIDEPPKEPPSSPVSGPLKLAPSPEVTYSAPSGPKARLPSEWLGYCWHQSSIRVLVLLTDVPAEFVVSRTSLPEIMQPSVLPPGFGVGQASPHFAPGGSPSWWSYAYRA